MANRVIIPVLLQKVQGRTGLFLPSYAKTIPSQALTSFSVPVVPVTQEAEGRGLREFKSLKPPVNIKGPYLSSIN